MLCIHGRTSKISSSTKYVARVSYEDGQCGDNPRLSTDIYPLAVGFTFLRAIAAELVLSAVELCFSLAPRPVPRRCKRRPDSVR